MGYLAMRPESRPSVASRSNCNVQRGQRDASRITTTRAAGACAPTFELAATSARSGAPSETSAVTILICTGPTTCVVEQRLVVTATSQRSYQYRWENDARHYPPQDFCQGDRSRMRAKGCSKSHLRT